MDETEKELLFVQMSLDDAREKGKDKFVVPALIKLGILSFQLASQASNSDARKAEANSLFDQAEKHFNDATFESKKLRINIDVSQQVLIQERLCSIAEYRGKYDEMARCMSKLETLATREKDSDCLRRTRNGMCFAMLKQKKWPEVLELSFKQLKTYNPSEGWAPKDALRLTRFFSDAVSHLPVTDDLMQKLDALRKDIRFVGMEGFKPILLRARCTVLNKTKNYKELCKAAGDYALELKSKDETRRQCAEMFRLSAIAYNNLGRHNDARHQSQEGRDCVSGGPMTEKEDQVTFYLCAKEETKSLNQLRDYEGMVKVIASAEPFLEAYVLQQKRKGKAVEGKEECTFYTNFGFAHQQLGRDAEALTLYEKAVNYAEKAGELGDKHLSTVLSCGNIALEIDKTSWGIVFLGRFLQRMKATNEDTACKALVIRSKLFVTARKVQDAIDSLTESWTIATELADPKRNDEGALQEGKNVRMALIISSELAEIYKSLDNNTQYCAWKETEIDYCERFGEPLDVVNTKINFISNLMAAGLVDLKATLQKHFREASALVKAHDLQDCGEQLSKLYVNLLSSDDMIDTEFSEKILSSGGLSAVSKFNVAISEIKTHVEKGRLKEAEASIATLEATVSDAHDEIELMLVQATLATKKGDLEAAGTLLEGAIKKANASFGGSINQPGSEKRSREGLKLKASALKQSGGNLNIRGQYDKSLKRLQESMAIYIEIGDKEGELGALSSIGYVYLDLKEDTRAESAFKQTLDFAKTTGNKVGLCNALLDLGNLYINSREIEKSETHVTDALKIAQGLKMEYNVARAYAALCNIEFMKKDYKKSFEFANKAKELLANAEDAVFAARLLANLGNIYDKLGGKGANSGAATLEFHKKNLKFAKESGDNVLYCTSLLTLGEMVNQNICTLLEKEAEDETGNHIYVTKDIVNEAIKYYNECLVVAKRNHDLTSEGNALRGIASTKRLEISSRMHMRNAVALRKTTRSRNILKRLQSGGRKKAESMQREMNMASTQYLLWAARTGDLDRIKELIKLQKVDPDTCDETQYTAVHHAAQEGHLEVVKYLIEEAKASAQCETIHFDTPYALALSRGRKEVSDYLKDIAGVLPFVKSKVMKEVEQRRTTGVRGDYKEFSEYHRLAWNGQISQDLSDHDDFDIFKRTTLMMAAYRGHVDWVRAKLAYSSPDENPATSVVKKDVEDWNALHWCCASKADVNAQLAIADLLLGLHISLLRERDAKGRKPHDLALSHGNKKLANLLEVRYQAKGDNFLLPLLRSVMFLFVMMLYGFFFPLFVIVGYLRRRRIARILGKIPQTCFQILRPSQKMVFQKVHRLGLSERLIFFLVLPFFLFMWIYPSILILGILPSFGDQEDIRSKILYLLGIYYIFMAVFLFHSTVKCFNEKELRNVRHPRKRIRMKILPNDFRTSGTRAVINVVRILICIFDFLAFANFGIPKNLLDITNSQSSDEYHVLDGWKGFGSQIILDFRRNTFVYSFWLGLFTVFIWFLLSTYLGSSMVILHNKKLGKMFPFVQPDFFSNIPGLSSLVPILAVAAVLPVSSIFFRALDCTYVSQGDVTNMRNGVLFFEQRGVNMTLLQLPPETGPSFSLVDHCRGLGINETALLPATWQSCDYSAYTTPCPLQFLSGLPDQVLGCCPVTECPKGYASCLQSQRDIKCWSGVHNFYALVGLTYLMYYIPSCVVIGIYFMEPDEDVSDIRFTGAYMMLEIALKWIMSLLYTFFDGLPIITQIGCIAVTGALACANYKIQPCKTIWSMNHYRSSAYLLNCWIAMSALVGVVMKREDVEPAKVVGIEVSVWIILLVLGGGLIVFLTLLVHATKLQVPLSKLFSKIKENSRKAALKERRETELMKQKSGPGGSGRSMVVNPIHESAGQRLHAMTMDIELTQINANMDTKMGKTSFIKTENPLSRSPVSSVDNGKANPLAEVAEEEERKANGNPANGDPAHNNNNNNDEDDTKATTTNPLADQKGE